MHLQIGQQCPGDVHRSTAMARAETTVARTKWDKTHFGIVTKLYEAVKYVHVKQRGLSMYRNVASKQGPGHSSKTKAWHYEGSASNSALVSSKLVSK